MGLSLLASTSIGRTSPIGTKGSVTEGQYVPIHKLSACSCDEQKVSLKVAMTIREFKVRTRARIVEGNNLMTIEGASPTEAYNSKLNQKMTKGCLSRKPKGLPKMSKEISPTPTERKSRSKWPKEIYYIVDV
ncbi:hypothetical protein Tco_1250951, partial [Tanacetum coccineum]